jgi:hypothetical protein
MNTLDNLELSSHVGLHTLRVTVVHQELVTSVIIFVARYGAKKSQKVSQRVVDVILDSQHAVDFIKTFNKTLLSRLKMTIEVRIDISVCYFAQLFIVFWVINFSR